MEKFIKSIFPEATDEQVGRIVDKHKQQLDGLSNQIKEANKQIEEFKAMDIDAIKKAADEYKSKFQASEKENAIKLADMEYRHLVDMRTNGLKFTSNSAREAFTSKLVLEKLKCDNGAILGFDDYVAQYKQKDPGAFVSDSNIFQQGINNMNQPNDSTPFFGASIQNSNRSDFDSFMTEAEQFFGDKKLSDRRMI